MLVALGGAGTDAALGMIVVQILANGALQQLVQPLAMGAALGIHPLAVLIVTIAGGALFGAIGLILAAPLTSAATRISADLARARALREAEAAEAAAAAGRLRQRLLLDLVELGLVDRAAVEQLLRVRDLAAARPSPAVSRT